MNYVRHFNLFAIGLPFLLSLVGIIFETFLFYALISTMLTGLIQVLLAIYLLINTPKNKHLNIYCCGVIAYFSIWLIVDISQQDLAKFNVVFVVIPILLAIFLTIIISKHKNYELS